MDQILDLTTIWTFLADAWSLLSTQVRLFLLPGWKQYQLAIVIGLIFVAWALRWLLEPRVDAWARTREGWAKWRLRLLIQLRQRLGLVCYAVLAWIVYGVMQQATWPSRSYLVGVAATIVTVWLLVGLLAVHVAIKLPTIVRHWRRTCGD